MKRRLSQKITRFMNKDGTFNASRVGVSHGFDSYHRLLSMSWKHFLLTVAILYFAVNVLFAGAYFLSGTEALAGARGASLSERLYDCFFFSVQTLATIGYGRMAPVTLVANLLVTFEALLGMMGLALATGLLFARFSKPTARVVFSNHAVVHRWKGEPALMFRIANTRRNQIVKAEIDVVLSMTKTNTEGERFSSFFDLKLLRRTSPFFALSWTVIHVINDESPFKAMSYEDLVNAKAEIFVSLMGLDDTFSQTVHARHSYTPDEIAWGSSFVDILSQSESNHLVIDISRIHDLKAESS